MGHIQKSLLGSALLLVLTACGGGGGSPSTADKGPVTGVAVDLSNENTAQKVAADAVNAPSRASSLTSSASTLGALTGVESSTTPQVHRLGLDEVGQKLTRIAFKKASRNPKAITAATYSETEICDNGGTLAVTETTSRPDYLNAGDNLSILANNCSFSESGETVWMNGGMTLNVLSGLNIDPDNLPVGASFGFSTSALSVEISANGRAKGGVMDGGFKMTVNSSSSFRIQTLQGYSGITQQSTVNGTTERTTMTDFDYTLSSSSRWGASATISGYATVNTNRVSTSTGGASQYRWETNNPVTYTSLVNTSGQMTITSAANSARVRLTFGQRCIVNNVASNTCVLFEHDTGNGDYKPGTTYSWDALTAL